MAGLNAQQISSLTKDKSFLLAIEQGLVLTSQRVLLNTSPFELIGDGSRGRPAYLKRVDFANKSINNPELYSIEAARVLMNQNEDAYKSLAIAEITNFLETQIATSPVESKAYYIYDVCAGVVLNDLDIIS